MLTMFSSHVIILLTSSFVGLTGAAPESAQLYLEGGLTILTQNLLDGRQPAPFVGEVHLLTPG